MPDKVRFKGFSLSSFPNRKEVLNHQLESKSQELEGIEKRLKRLYYLDDRPGVVMITGPSPEIQIISLEDKKAMLMESINEIEQELKTL